MESKIPLIKYIITLLLSSMGLQKLIFSKLSNQRYTNALLRVVENKYAIIGFDTKGNLLEILYNIIDSESINVFHVMRCRNSFIKQYKDMRGKDKWR